MFRLAPFLLFSLLAAAAGPGAAQERRPSHCIAIAEAAPGLEYVQPAAWGDPLGAFEVRLSYIDHSMYLIEAPDGTRIVTDYTGFIGVVDLVPDVVTMNNAHDSHFTVYPDPAIPHVLEGWARRGKAAEHRLEVGEVLIRNVPTDVRSPFGQGARKDGNSIFVFEVAGLCIGHLGHLHHEPDEAQYAALGRLDVVMAAVDGGLTLDLPTMTRVLKRLKSSVVLPMHWFSPFSLERFLDGMADEFEIRRAAGHEVVVSLRTLPDRPTVIALDPAYLQPRD